MENKSLGFDVCRDGAPHRPGHVGRWAFVACFLAWLLSGVTLREEAMLKLFNLSWNEVGEKIPQIAEAGYTSL